MIVRFRKPKKVPTIIDPRPRCPYCYVPIAADQMTVHCLQNHSALVTKSLNGNNRAVPHKASSALGLNPSLIDTPPSASRPSEFSDRDFVPMREDRNMLADLPKVMLPFDLLPSGRTSIETLLSKLTTEVTKSRSRSQEQVWRFDLERIQSLRTLNPKCCYVGRDLWRGYIIFEFDWTRKVVLDCPIEGNAIYVLPEDWRPMVVKSKFVLRTTYGHLTEKVVHKGDWLNRLKAILKSSIARR